MSVHRSDQPSFHLVKLTGYRLFSISVIASFGIPKAILSYRGQSAMPTTLDWVSGVLFVIGLYWLGQYESVEPHVFPWLFEYDYSRIAFFFPLQVGLRVLQASLLCICCCGYCYGADVTYNKLSVAISSGVIRILVFVLFSAIFISAGVAVTFLPETRLYQRIDKLSTFPIPANAKQMANCLGILLGLLAGILITNNIPWALTEPISR